jgi:hypothetical protein
MDDTGRSPLYGSACAMPGEGPIPASDIGPAGGTAAAAKAGDEVVGWLLGPRRRSKSTAIKPTIARTTAPPTAMPAIAPTPSFDPLLLLDAPAVPVAAEPATVITPGIVVDWPGVRVMTDTLAEPPAELCRVTVDITVFEAPAVNVFVAGAWVTVTAVVPPAGAGAGVVATVAGLAQEFHCASLMFRGSPVPPQFVFSTL